MHYSDALACNLSHYWVHIGKVSIVNNVDIIVTNQLLNCLKMRLIILINDYDINSLIVNIRLLE